MAGRRDKMLPLLKALADKTRLEILRLLGTRQYCVGALAVRLGITQGAVSQHLRLMQAAGLLTAVRCGYYVHYRIDRAAMARFSRALQGILNPGKTERR